MKRDRNYLLGISQREQIKAFVPPDYALKVARSRTGGMLSYFLQGTRGVSFMTYNDWLERLVNPAYLQGVNDAAIAMAMQEERNEP